MTLCRQARQRTCPSQGAALMVGVLLITHNQIGTALLDTATDMLGMWPLMVEARPVKPDCEPEAMVSRGRALVRDLNHGYGVLVLTDMYGSTPSNIAARLAADDQVMVACGVNLPMLGRVMNYPRLSLPDLADKAESGGRDGIFPYVPRNERKWVERKRVSIIFKLGLLARAAAKFV